MTALTSRLELPSNLSGDLRKSRIYEWITLAYLVSVVVLMYLVLGSSQAMKAAWLEDLISLIPPVAVLVGLHLRTRPATSRFPYGCHKALGISFQVASVALCVMGVYLIYDATTKLLAGEHPTIGTVILFGQPIWLGWLMLPALLYSGAPATLLGHMKLKPAYRIHNKPMIADAAMNTADWMTAAAAMVGVLGIGLGFWWADSAAALIIGLDILRDGTSHLKNGVFDLMDREPLTVDNSQVSEIPRKVQDRLGELEWVQHVEVRMREAGQVFFGEAFITPVDEDRPIERTAEANREARRIDWRVHDLVIELRSSSSQS